jgi:hypothetical protein
LKIPALYDLGWDPGEQYDIVFNGAAPTRGDFKSSPGRYSGQDNGWIGVYITSVQTQFWGELKTHPNIPISRSAPALTRISRRNSGRARRRPKEYCEGSQWGPPLFFPQGRAASATLPGRRDWRRQRQNAHPPGAVRRADPASGRVPKSVPISVSQSKFAAKLSKFSRQLARSLPKVSPVLPGCSIPRGSLGLP